MPSTGHLSMPDRRSCSPSDAGLGTGAHHPVCRSPSLELLPFAGHTIAPPSASDLCESLGRDWGRFTFPRPRDRPIAAQSQHSTTRSEQSLRAASRPVPRARWSRRGANRGRPPARRRAAAPRARRRRRTRRPQGGSRACVLASDRASPYRIRAELVLAARTLTIERTGRW